MRSLFDSTFLIALLDDDHNFHDRAIDWFHDNKSSGWASCPLTQNAFLRILSQPGYSSSQTYALIELRDLLRRNIRDTDHEFWPDDISLLDSSRIDFDRIFGPNQLTDIYLLAIANHRDGRLVTFDERIPLSAVRNATPANLCIV